MTSNDRKVLTVSVAAYNVGKYLTKALESCAVANAEKLEVLVVNDGSGDNTLEIARMFEKCNPETFKVIDKENGGYGSTFNVALQEARGRYFRYLDGDDWFNPEALDGYIGLLEQSSDDAVFTPYMRVFEDGSPAEVWDDLSAYTEGRYCLDDLGEAPRIAACALAYRTDLLRNMGFKMSEHCFYTDVEYACLPFTHVKTVRVSKLPLYRYRIGREGQSVSLSGIERHYKDIIRVCMRLLCELNDDALQSSRYLLRSVTRECVAPFNFITKIPPSAERKADLMVFDSTLRQRSVVADGVARLSRRMRLLQATSFLAYAPLCRLSVWRSHWVR